MGGKLGHGSRTDEKYPRLIEQFQVLNLQPMVVAAGAWHAAVVGQDGRVCTWGWGRYGCLGHGNEECESVPKVVEALGKVKAVHVATGDYTTFVVSDDGDVYSFGCGESSSLGHNTGADGQVWLSPNFSFLSSPLIWLYGKMSCNFIFHKSSDLCILGSWTLLINPPQLDLISQSLVMHQERSTIL